MDARATPMKAADATSVVPAELTRLHVVVRDTVAVAWVSVFGRRRAVVSCLALRGCHVHMARLSDSTSIDRACTPVPLFKMKRISRESCSVDLIWLSLRVTHHNVRQKNARRLGIVLSSLHCAALRGGLCVLDLAHELHLCFVQGVSMEVGWIFGVYLISYHRRRTSQACIQRKRPCMQILTAGTPH